ncbi:MAG: transcriptional regulator, MerR family [Ilumatobacteraceae bacterium]|nr:transcriptional regulator, MerR family [Ilumatobacteraceae bacterium]
MAVTEIEPQDLSISEAAALIGVSVHTLRYYERAGLMRDTVPRAASTHRRYRANDVYWVQFITRLRSTGMSIQQIHDYAEMARRGDGNEAERLALLERHRDRVLAQMREIEGHLAAIDFKIEIYRGHLTAN